MIGRLRGMSSLTSRLLFDGVQIRSNVVAEDVFLNQLVRRRQGGRASAQSRSSDP